MATNPDEDDPGETFREAFPHLFREAITGTDRGDVGAAVLLITAGVCLVAAPIPFSAIGIVALFLLNMRTK
jgi:hypothetical protein